jgi:hypothetical protein
MVKVYATTLALGILGLLIIILGGALAENVGSPERDPGALIGLNGKSIVGAMVGFGMAGMSAEFSPLDLTWQVSLLLASLAAGASVVWVRYSVSQADHQ